MSEDFQKGKKITEGKTKALYEVQGNPHLLWVKSKEDITAFDDKKYTKSFGTKAEYATTTTCRVFELLQAAGIPCGYVKQVSPTEFIVERLDMIQLEVVARRFAVGSYLDRNPQLAKPEGRQPHRFHSLCTEFFLKTSKGKLLVNDIPVLEGIRGLVKNKEKGGMIMGVLDDPFILNPGNQDFWNLANPKLPSWHKKFNLSLSVKPSVIYRDPADMEEMSKILRRVFYILEKAWAVLGMRLIDFKLEFGYDSSGKLKLGDVVDNDSWRIRLLNWTDYSKQSFRDGEDLSKVEKKYGHIARLSERLKIPEQVIVVWRGSPKDDDLMEIRKGIPDIIKFVDVVASGHKATAKALKILNELEGQYLEGGFIIANVGRSNGLGPTLATHTSWPVQSIVATFDKHSEDMWSSINMPSDAPHTATPYPKLALQAALNHLALSNPVAYMLRQEKIESLDNEY